jgi:coenzyme A diphosphatase NUDT7
MSADEVFARLAGHWRSERAAGRDHPAPLAPRRASVLVPLVTAPLDDASDADASSSSSSSSSSAVRVLLCTRSAALSSHAGEVCLPGGKNDPHESDAEAALREAEEEVGLRRGDAEVLAQFPPFLSKGRVSVRPVVARVADPGFVPRPNPDEVRECFAVPLESFLVADESYAFRDWEFLPGRFIRVHRFEREGRDVWGLTAAVLIAVAEKAYGREAAFPKTPPGPGGTSIQNLTSGDERERENQEDAKPSRASRL